MPSVDNRQDRNSFPIEKLDKQDKRNKEIAREKTVEDTKKQILEVDMTETKFGADEEKMIYFFLLSSLRKEHFVAVGIEENIRPICPTRTRQILWPILHQRQKPSSAGIS